MSLIELRSICKTYKSAGLDVEVLKDVSLRIEEGEYVSIIGPSGAGKSTLMTIMGCLGLPTQGIYILDGEEVGRASDRELSRIRNEKIGFVFQAFHLLPGVKAIDNVMMPLLYSRRVPKDAKLPARGAGSSEPKRSVSSVTGTPIRAHSLTTGSSDASS